MATTLNITDNFTELVSKFNELSAGVGTITGLDIEGESDLANIVTSMYALIDSDTDFRSKISVSDAGGDGSLSYNPSTGIITYTGPTAGEVRAHFSAGGDLSYNSSTGVFSFTDSAQRSDDDIRGLLSVTDAGGDGSLSYNSSTGVITYTGPSASEVRAHFSAGNGIAISSGSIALETPTRFRLFDSTGATLLDLYGAGSL